MAQLVNPYVAGPPVGGRGFFGRREVLEWIAQRLSNPLTRSLVLFGQRRIGKTSVLLQLYRLLPPELFLPVYFDLHDQAERPLGEVLAEIASAVAERAGLALPDPTLFDDRGLFFSRTFLPAVYEALGESRRLVFLFDEFGIPGAVNEKELPPTSAWHSLFRFARRLMTQDPRPAFVFTLGRRVEDVNVDFTAMFKASAVKEIWVLERESAEALVRQAELGHTLQFTDQAVARVLSFTAGHPYFTQLLCWHLWEQAYASNPVRIPRIGVEEVEAAAATLVDTAEQPFTWLWEGLSLAERIYAIGLAGLAGEGEVVAEERVLQTLADHAARLCTREVELRAPRDLVRRRVLELVEEGEHRFTLELLRRWVRRRYTLDDAKEELDRVDPLADELFGIGQEFFRREQWQMAERYFRDALAAYPDHFRARLRLGETLLSLSRPDEAVAELERAYELDRKEARVALTRALVAQARAREERGDEDGALASCERILQVSPGDYTAQRIRNGILARRLETQARTFEQSAQWAQAAAIYERLMQQIPDGERVEEWQAAHERCQKELMLARLFTEGLAALEKRRWQKAQQAFAEIVRERPDYRVGKRLAAGMLLRAVQQRPIRLRRSYGGLLAMLAILVIMALAAGAWYIRPWKGSLPVSLPDHWKLVHTYRLDTDSDGHEEWVVLYRFDLSEGSGEEGKPIGGIVYRTENSGTVLVGYELWPREGEYLCECECLVAMEELLSGLAGPELVVRDRCDGRTTRLSLFSWDATRKEYVPRGHFVGSRVEAGRDEVTVEQRLPHRAQLALRQFYRPLEGRTYYQPGELGVLVMPEKYELAFYHEEPADVLRSPYPEKVVLAFYNHYGDEAWVEKLFTPQGWARVAGCSTGLCGCSLSSDEGTRVRVTDLRAREHTAEQAVFDFSVVCEPDGREPEDEATVRWYLVRQDGRWYLDGAELSGRRSE
ncbi:MAG: tetratricopeptide repeat protein [Anaerolineae bacterium]|nr:tetratricopeptide repeat protein [Anaerolineae bacterium]